MQSITKLLDLSSQADIDEMAAAATAQELQTSGWTGEQIVVDGGALLA